MRSFLLGMCREVSAGRKINFWVGECSNAIWAHSNMLALYCETRISTCHNWWRSILSSNNGHYRGWYQDIIFRKLQLSFLLWLWRSSDCPVSSGMLFTLLINTLLANQFVLGLPCAGKINKFIKQWETELLSTDSSPGPDETAISSVPVGAIVFTVGGWMDCC